MSEFVYQTLRESIVSALRMKILNQQLKPGERIVEQKLAEEFHSSRGPIREALRQLEQEGLVEYSRNVGCSARRITAEDVYEIHLLRASYEIIALRDYDCSFTEEELLTMEHILEKMKTLSVGELNRMTDLDNDLHRVVVQKTGRNRLIQAWEALNYGNLIAGVYSSPYRENMALRQYEIHKGLVEVFRERDTQKACTALYDHYMLPLKRIKEENEAKGE